MNGKKSRFSSLRLGSTDAAAAFRDVSFAGQNSNSNSNSNTSKNSTAQDATESKYDETLVTVKLRDGGVRSNISSKWIQKTFKNTFLDDDSNHNVPVSSRVFDAIRNPSSFKAYELTYILLGAAIKHGIEWLQRLCYGRIGCVKAESFEMFANLVGKLCALRMPVDVNAVKKIIGDIDISHIFKNIDLHKALNDDGFNKHFNDICKYDTGVVVGIFLNKLLNGIYQYSNSCTDDNIADIVLQYQLFFERKAKEYKVCCSNIHSCNLCVCFYFWFVC